MSTDWTAARTTATSTVLALRPKEAATALGIGERKLWELTQPRGPIPCARLGTCIVYPVDLLRDWLANQAKKEAGEQ